MSSNSLDTIMLSHLCKKIVTFSPYVRVEGGCELRRKALKFFNSFRAFKQGFEKRPSAPLLSFIVTLKTSLYLGIFVHYLIAFESFSKSLSVVPD